MRWWVDKADNGLIRFEGTLDPADIHELPLSDLHRAAITSPVESAADFLQSLELLFRCGEEKQG